MSQWSLTQKPTHYPANTITATPQGWTYTDPVSGQVEVIACLRGLDAKNTDAAVPPTWALTLMANGNYVTDSVMTLTLVPNEAVTVSGKPYIVVTIGSTARNFVYDATTSTSTSLKFSYVVDAGDVDADGITVAASLTKGTGKVFDQAGTNLATIAGAISYTVGSAVGITVN